MQPNGTHLADTSAQYRLHVIVVGAGIAGVALAGLLGHSGHQVTVLEAAPRIAEVGAGILCAPNMTRLFSRWGLDTRIRPHADALTHVDLKRWEAGQALGAAPLMPQIEQKHGAAQYVMHRADLHGALMADAQTVAEIRTGSMVVAVDFDAPSVRLADGTVLHADLVVGADGMKSTCRKLLYDHLGLIDRAIPTGDAAFRATIPLSQVTDPDLRDFVQRPGATRWLGGGRHVQGYPIRHGSLYNMVLLHPDKAPGLVEESWTTKASKEDILDNFGSWDSRHLRKLLDLIPPDNVMVWHLCQHEPLPTWSMGKMVLLGDASHPMLPYIAQGAAQAVEDVAVLHLALNRVSCKQDLPVMLKAYELARRSRAEQIMGMAGLNQSVLHYPDGPMQQDRDRKFLAVAQGGENPDLLGDPRTQSFLWGYDPEQEFLDNLPTIFDKAKALHTNGHS